MIMKKIKIFLILMMVILLSCKKENDVSILPVNSSKDLKIADNFGWKTLKDVNANLKFVTSNKSAAIDAFIEIYAGDTNSGKVIFDGYTNECGIIDSLSFKIGNYYNTVQIIHNGFKSRSRYNIYYYSK